MTLDGVTPVAIPTNLFRINSALIMSAGTGKVNAGAITIRDSGGGTTRSVMPIGYGITRKAIYTVPAGFTLSVLSHFVSINRSVGVSRYATLSNFIQSSNGFYRMPLEFSLGDVIPYRHDGNPGIILAEKTDYALRAQFVSSDNTDITAAILGVLKSNTVN